MQKLHDVRLSEWCLEGDFSPVVEVWDMDGYYLQLHRKSGYMRRTQSQEGLQPYGEWYKDKEAVYLIGYRE